MKMELTKSAFLFVIDHTPLISIDLIVKNESDQVLLGLRRHRPAQGYWFVPGSRIKKKQLIHDTFTNVTMKEIGKTIEISGSNFLGVFEHLYQDNFFNIRGITTHYIVLAFEIRLIGYPIDNNFITKKFSQHSEMRWWSIDDLLADEEVHPYTKAYFNIEQKTKVL